MAGRRDTIHKRANEMLAQPAARPRQETQLPTCRRTRRRRCTPHIAERRRRESILLIFQKAVIMNMAVSRVQYDCNTAATSGAPRKPRPPPEPQATGIRRDPNRIASYCSQHTTLLQQGKSVCTVVTIQILASSSGLPARVCYPRTSARPLRRRSTLTSCSA